MRFKTIQILCAILFFVLVSKAQTVEQWKADLQFLSTELPKRHKNLFHTMTREQFETAVKQLDAKIPTLTNNQIALELA